MPASHVVRFGVFELDCVSGELRRHGLKIRLPDQSFQILKLLLSRPGELVTREELRGVLWTSETFVGFDAGLNGAVRKLRDALDDSADSPRFVETLPRRGYRFVASVSAPAAGSEPVPDRISPDSGIDPAPPPLQRPPSPSRLRSTAWRAAGLAILVMSAAAAGLFYQRGGFDFLRAGDHAQPFRAVVVLPFKNLTGDAAQDRFADTVSDAVTVRLSQAAGLDVISGMSARHYKDTEKHPRVIAQELQVDGLVAGTVVRSAAGLGITVHLIRAATGHEEWAQSYEGDMSHMIALQQRIASQIAVAAGRAAPRPGGIATTQAIVPQAYDAYSRECWPRGSRNMKDFDERRRITKRPSGCSRILHRPMRHWRSLSCSCSMPVRCHRTK